MEEEFDTSGNIQDCNEVEITVAETLANDKRKGNIGLLNLCVIFTYHVF